ncbi:efflux RND transporter periplasmic adaptor subunit [Desulfobulbus rhabdoformis]|uniref:efflux RND transporter periplasmic adaptor subunit n=1 Tax=Desulfobulbus rhabdoformis TaxID=34032 RepID=UPI0019645DFA|nr:efflux RND transporter periplasmic adaptor subunit [Desulfobulbus rhabdoformis]MBM9612913.1 efflux RND transporter periplasmic adaptor subunit [Desulfobulbus rhabdoformis]
MKRRKSYVLIAVVAIVLALLVVQVSRKQWQKDEDLNVTAKALPVTIAAVVQHEFTDDVEAVGTLKARETSLLSPKVAGPVNQVLVDIGDPVIAGEVVIRLDRTNYGLGVKQAQAALAAAEAAISQADAQFEQAEKEFHRATELLEEKVIPQSRFEAAEAAFKSAREAVSHAKAQRDRARAALETALEHLKDTEIRSPISGAVVERTVEIGQAVEPGVQILRIIDQSYLKADIDLPEGDIGRLAPDDTAMIMVDAYPKEVFPGKVVSINPMVDRQTRTFRVRIQVPNQQGKLMDGMFARVRLSVGRHCALAVPRDALSRLPGSGTYYVFFVEGNKAVKRTVEIGAVNDQWAEVMKGLVEDDKVVTSGTGRLRSGMDVTVQDVSNKNETDRSGETTLQEDRR